MRDKNPVWPGIEPTSRLASAAIMTEGPFQSTPTLHSTFQQITRKHELTTRGREALWSHAAGCHDMLDLLNWDEKGGARLGKKCNIVLVRRLDTSWGNITHRESNVCINITPIYVYFVKHEMALWIIHPWPWHGEYKMWVTWIYLTDCLALSWDIVFTQHRLHQDNEQSPISGDRWHTGGCMTPAKINFIRGEINVVWGPVNIPHKGHSWDQIKFSIVLDLTAGSDLW